MSAWHVGTGAPAEAASWETAPASQKPAIGGEAVLDRGREFVLGRQPIINSDDQHARVLRQPSTQPVMGFEVTLYPPTAVEIRDGRLRRASDVRGIDARGDLAGGPGDDDVLD